MHWKKEKPLKTQHFITKYIKDIIYELSHEFVSCATGIKFLVEKYSFYVYLLHNDIFSLKNYKCILPH